MISMAAYILRTNGRSFVLLALLSRYMLVTLAYSRCNSAQIQINMFNGTSSGNLTSPNYPDLTPINSTCLWKLTCPKGRIIKLHFQELTFSNLSNDQGYLEIRDGLTSTSSVIIKYGVSNLLVNNRSVPIVYSSGNNISLHLKMGSNNSSSRVRFHVWYSSTKPGKTCSVNNTDDENNNIILQPPVMISVGKDLSSKVGCTWKIPSITGSSVKLKLNISNDLFCSVGNVYFFGGPYGFASVLKQSLCQEQNLSTPGPFVLTSRQGLSFQLKTLNFSSDLHLNFQIFPEKEGDGCILEKPSYSGAQGFFSTSHYYDSTSVIPKTSCKRKIKNSSGKHLKFTIFTVDLPSTNGCLNNVKLFEEQEFSNKSTLRAQFCGATSILGTNINIIIYSGRALITVQSEASYHSKGVFAAFRSIGPAREKSMCSEYNHPKENVDIILTDDEGKLESPNYPSTFPPGMVCKWTIQPSGMADNDQIGIKFHWIDFEGKDNQCNQGYVEIKANNGSKTQRFCGPGTYGDLPIMYFEDAKKITITFVSTPFYTTRKGFSASYKVKIAPTSSWPFTWTVTGVLFGSIILLLAAIFFCIYQIRKTKKRNKQQLDNEVVEPKNIDQEPNDTLPPLDKGPPPPYQETTEDSPLVRSPTAEKPYPWFRPGTTITEHSPRERRSNLEQTSEI